MLDLFYINFLDFEENSLWKNWTKFFLCFEQTMTLREYKHLSSIFLCDIKVEICITKIHQCFYFVLNKYFNSNYKWKRAQHVRKSLGSNLIQIVSNLVSQVCQLGKKFYPKRIRFIQRMFVFNISSVKKGQKLSHSLRRHVIDLYNSFLLLNHIFLKKHRLKYRTPSWKRFLIKTDWLTLISVLI